MKNSKNISKKYLSYFLPGLFLLFFIVVWELATRELNIQKWILPKPTEIFTSFWEAREILWQHTLQTLLETAIGFGLAIVAGVLWAVVMDFSVLFRKTFYPLLVISQTIPIIAVAPLFIIWFGYGLLPKVIVVALVCFFPIATNLADGLRSVDRDMVKLMDGLGASTGQIFKMVKLPASLPFFFSGLRVAGTYSVMGAVIGEWLGADKGLGIFLTRSTQSFQTARVFAIIMVIMILSLVLVFGIDLLEKKLTPWHWPQA